MQKSNYKVLIPFKGNKAELAKLILTLSIRGRKVDFNGEYGIVSLLDLTQADLNALDGICIAW